jgi:predicted DNA-binding antitoxin AbrB/MazE fold protein
MSTSFAQLKKSRQSNFDKLVSEVSKLDAKQQQGQQEDNRFWYPEVDKSGNGYAVIRFLPAPSGEDVPFVRVWDHGFQGPGGWYIEKSLTTLGQKDPVSEYNSQLWNSGIESNKQQVRKQKRRLNFFSNILVVKDPANPANEGKVFLFKFGKKIFDKLNAAMNPEFEDEKPLNPFDMWEGANFKIKIRNVEGYRNYDKSEFDSPAPISEDDKELEALWSKQYQLQEFVDLKNFKSYDELKAKLHKVLCLDGSAPKPTSRAVDNEEDTMAAPKRPTKSAKELDQAFEEDDDNMDFFKKLAEEE